MKQTSSMNQTELRSYLREQKREGNITFTVDGADRHWTAAINGQLGLTTDHLREIADSHCFPPSGWDMPSAGDPQPEAEEAKQDRKPAKGKLSKEDVYKLLETLASDDSVDEAEVRRIANEAVDERIKEGLPEKTVVITPVSRVEIEGEVTHSQFGLITTLISADENVALVGEAGTGKTHMCEMVARALNLDFYWTGKIDTEHQLIGYRDAHGSYFETAFFKAFTKGGLFLWDEFDASSPRAATRFNSAIGNRFCDFPTGLYKAHPNFRVIAASNTYWSGATREYVGRNQMDAATKDRFVFVDVGYDRKVEKAIAARYPNGAEIAKRVQSVRKAIAKLKLRHIVSMRATNSIANTMAAGLTQKQAEKVALWKDLSKQQIAKIEAEIGGEE